MKTNKISIKPFSAKATFGLTLGYTEDLIPKTAVIQSIQVYQDQLISKRNIYLSVSITECSIVLSGQNEPHLQLNFINYPKFPLEETDLKQEIEKMIQHLMGKFQQNRVVIAYKDETIMLERSSEIDPKILKN